MKIKILIPAMVCAMMTNAQSFDNIINTIVKNNPQLKEQVHQDQADRLELADQNMLADPEVSFARVWGRHDIGNKLQLDVSQEFEWPGLYIARTRLSNTMQTSAQLSLMAQQLDLSMQAKLKLTELVYVVKQLDALKSCRERINSMQSVVDTKRAGGIITVIDHRKLSIEVYKLDSRINSLQSDRMQIVSDLQTMAGGVDMDLSSITDYSTETVLGENDYIQMVRNYDPEIAAATATIDTELMQQKIRGLKRIPNLKLGYQHQAEMGDRFNGFTVGISLPFFQNRRARAAANERVDASVIVSEALVGQKEAEVRTLYKTMCQARDLYMGYRDVFDADTYLPLLQKAYDGGELSVIEYITELQYYTDAVIEYLDLDYQYKTAIVKLNKYDLLNP